VLSAHWIVLRLTGIFDSYTPTTSLYFLSPTLISLTWLVDVGGGQSDPSLVMGGRFTRNSGN
jgi:hypothetical protein